MELKEAILQRRSIRGYLPKPVPRQALEEVLELACRSASALNTQPWEFVVAAGAPLEAIREDNVQALCTGVPFDVPEPETAGVYKTRRVEVAKQLFAAMDIQREDKAKRNAWLERGFRFFDAPALILICMDESLNETVARLDIGCITQNLCLAAMEFGLGTCVQSQAIMLQGSLKKHLTIPQGKRLEVGIAIGYPDPDFPANQVVSGRERVDALTTWCGF